MFTMRQSVSETLIEAVKKDIMSGKYQPGEKLPPENELCRMYEVGRSTLREAYKVLQTAGFIEIKPGRGAFASQTVPENTVDPVLWLSSREYDLYDIIEARRGIEPICAKLAAQRRDDRDITSMYATLYQYKIALDENNPQKMAEFDENLHKTIVKASRNKAFIAIYDKLCRMLRDYRVNLFSVEKNGGLAVPYHEKIVDRISARDAAGAYEAMNAHIEDIEKNIGDITHGS